MVEAEKPRFAGRDRNGGSSPIRSENLLIELRDGDVVARSS